MIRLNFLAALLVVLNFPANALMSNSNYEYTEKTRNENQQQNTESIQKRSYYLALEKKADANLAESLQPNWGNERTLYNKECFFRDVAEIYKTASLCAAELNMHIDVIRLTEKRAMIWAEKLDNVPAAIFQLLDVWKLCTDIEETTKASKVREKLHVLVEEEVAKRFAQRDNPAFAGFLHYCNFTIARSLLMKAEVFEVTDPLLSEDLYMQAEKFCHENDVSYDYVKETQHPQKQEEVENNEYDLENPNDLIEVAAKLENINQKEEAMALYEKAGNSCMSYYDQGIGIGYLHSALIAGLCFEKSARTMEQANNAYERVLKDYDEFDPENMDISTGDDLADRFFRFIFAAPFYLETSLASLKLERRDVFAEIIYRQVNDILSVFNSWPDLTDIYEEDDVNFLIEYFEALVNVSEIVLGSDHPSLENLRKSCEMLPCCLIKADQRTPSLQRIQLEAALLCVYTAPKDLTVEKMIERLEDKHLLRP